jgi:hypothetical protein
MDEVRISNHSAISLVAFVVTAKQASEPIVVYSDPLIESMAAPLAAGEERVVMEIGNEDRRRLLEEPIEISRARRFPRRAEATCRGIN